MGEIIVSTASLLITIATIVIAKVWGNKSSKTKTEAKKKIEITKIIQKLPEYINEAEKVLGTGTGLAKLNYVLNYIHVDCLDAGIEFLKDQWQYEVENILSTPQKKGDQEHEESRNCEK